MTGSSRCCAGVIAAQATGNPRSSAAISVDNPEVCRPTSTVCPGNGQLAKGLDLQPELPEQVRPPVVREQVRRTRRPDPVQQDPTGVLEVGRVLVGGVDRYESETGPAYGLGVRGVGEQGDVVAPATQPGAKVDHGPHVAMGTVTNQQDSCHRAASSS